MDRKITTHFLKLIRRNERIYIQELEDHFVVTDSYIMVRVPKDEFELNPLLFRPFNADSFIPNDKKYRNSKIVGYRPRKCEKGLLAELTDGKTEVYIDTEKLKFFEGCTFKIKTNVSPVFCYKGNIFYGIVLPVRISDKWWEFRGGKENE